MANSNFRSDRSRDPLAELARLIGQGEPYSGDHRNKSYNSVRPRAAEPREADWSTEERYGSPEDHAEARYAAPNPPAPSYPSQYASHQAQERGCDEELPGGRFFSGPAAQFNGFREEPGQGSHYDYESGPQHLPPARDLPAYAAASDDEQGYEADGQHYPDDEAEPADNDYEHAPSPRRRSALVVVMAIFGLVVVGTAGAFGYRAMFGKSVLPTLPPIIKASNGPNKIAPAYSDAQASAAGNAGQAAVTTTGSTENVVSREEQPVTIEPPKPAPRVVSTIPIVSSGQGAMPPGMSGMPPATIHQAAPGRVASADLPWPAPPPAVPGPAPAAAAPPPAQVSSEPKKIHTVTIRADQTGAVVDGASGSPAPARAQSRATAAAPRTNAAGPAGGSGGPMSIVPGSSGDAAPSPRTRMATAPTATAPMATANAGGGAAAAPAPGGGYAVQVTSQRTEGEAQATFRALRVKFPNQLNGREAIIRRADLGAKGTYYRALVGPFASAEEAAELCSGLKAAGGNCIVQRN